MSRPAGSKNKPKDAPTDGEAESSMEGAHLKEPIPFTGVARSLECHKHMERFPNFRIVTLEIVDGLVVKKSYSDPYARFDAEARLEIQMVEAGLNLSNHYQDGRAWLK